MTDTPTGRASTRAEQAKQIRVHGTPGDPPGHMPHGHSGLAVPTDALGWDCFAGSSALQLWARELFEALAVTDTAEDPWELTGTAVMLVGKDPMSFDAVLRRVAADAGMSFITLDGDVEIYAPPVKELQLDGGETAERNRGLLAEADATPALVHVRGGRWMANKHTTESEDIAELMRRFQSRVRQTIHAFDRECPIVIVLSADEITSLAESFRTSGLFNRFFHLPAPTMDAKGNAFIDRLGREGCAPSITGSPAKIGKLVAMEFDSERRYELAVLRFKRMFAREQRQLEFIDLVTVAARGFAEADAPPAGDADACIQTAYHEAGHVVMALVDSAGQNIPDYVSIVPCEDFAGVLIQSYEFRMSNRGAETYTSMCRKVRLSLAGRAAEEMHVGSAMISSGSRADLKFATELAGEAFAFWGFAPGMDDDELSGSNLAIVDAETITPTELAHTERLVRQFLAVEYEKVKETLAAHGSLLDAVAEQLVRHEVLDRDAIAALMRADIEERAKHVPRR
jgi:cell division protease FtsH